MSTRDQEKMLEDLTTQSMFRKLGNACFTKCVRRYDDGEITVGEGACIERCVAKYLDAYRIVNEHLTEKNREAQEVMGALPQ